MLSEHIGILFHSKIKTLILFARIIVSSGLTSPRLKRHLQKKKEPVGLDPYVGISRPSIVKTTLSIVKEGLVDRGIGELF